MSNVNDIMIYWGRVKMVDKNGKHALADTNTYMRISITPYEYPYAHTYMYAHKHAYIATRLHIHIFVPECVCCIKCFTVKQRKYSINSGIISSVIRKQHYANIIVKIWQNKKNKTDMHICTLDGRCAQRQNCFYWSYRGLSCWQPPVRSQIYTALSTPTRFWKAVYMNLPNAFRTKGSTLVRINLNALRDSVSHTFSYFVDILENILLRSWSYILQMSRKWCSSSTTLQNGHSSFVMGVLDLVYLIYLPSCTHYFRHH